MGTMHRPLLAKKSARHPIGFRAALTGRRHDSASPLPYREGRPRSRAEPERAVQPTDLQSLAAFQEPHLDQYLQQIQNFPMLDADEEFMLAKRWREHKDPEAAHRLITSHLRLVAGIARAYRGYGLPMSELIAQGISA